jgi:hypothetical protein
MPLAQIGAVIALALSALPPPPDKVVFQTRMYGTITVDHRLHLANRVSCRKCHGDGPVQKIGHFATPREAHERCRECHAEVKRGPTACNGCHVRPIQATPAPPAAAHLADTADGPTAEEPAAASGPGALVASHDTKPPDGTTPGASQLVASEARPADGVASSPTGPVAVRIDERARLRRTVEMGLTGVLGEGFMSGPAVRLLLDQGRFVVMHSLEFPGVFVGDARTLVLVGGGMKLPVARKLKASAIALGGLDAVDRTSTMLPALAVRLGVEWSPDGSFAHAFGVSLTGMTDVIQYRDALGKQIGGATLSTAITFAFRGPGARSRR